MTAHPDFDGRSPRAVAAMFLDGEDDEDLLRAGTCILAALLVGPVNQRIADLTGVPLHDVGNYGFRLRQAGIWRPRHGGMFYPWLDDVLDDDGVAGRGKVGFVLHSMVAVGTVVRLPDTDEYRAATILDGISGYPPTDPAHADAPLRMSHPWHRCRLAKGNYKRKVLT